MCARINEKTTFATEVYQQIQQLILSGAWREGDKLPTEHQLSAQFHVSRVVVREALQTLRAENLIVTKQGAGSFVSNPRNFHTHHFDTNSDFHLTEEEFQDLIDVRTYVEFRAIELAARRATEEDLEAVRLAAEEMFDVCGDLELFTQADYRFHQAVVTASHNRMLCHIMESCKEQFFYCLREMNKLRGDPTWAADLHRELYHLLAARDSGGAIRCLRKHNDYNHAKLMPFFSPKSE